MSSSAIPSDLSSAQAEAALEDARARFARYDTDGALKALDQILLSTHLPKGTFFLKSQCYERINWPTQSLQAAQAELLANPGYPGAAEQIRLMNQKLYKPGSERVTERPWATELAPNMIESLEHCSHRNTYRSVPLIKNVFDLAIYPMLLWDIKPATILEIGSCYGGSALWMADMMAAWGLDTHVYSVDINKVWTASHDRVTFIQGDGRALGAVFSDEFLASLPRPMLVIEDADHLYVTTKAVLEFFHDRLNDGETIIVEDVMTMPGEAGRALQEFLSLHPEEYLVDRKYCDFFGVNVTWCVNGFLKRVKATGSKS